jgi:hypothetical protein
MNEKIWPDSLAAAVFGGFGRVRHQRAGTGPEQDYRRAAATLAHYNPDSEVNLTIAWQ